MAVKRVAKKKGGKSGNKRAPNTSRKRAAKRKARKTGRQVASTRQERKAKRRLHGATRRTGETSGGGAAPARPGTGKRMTAAMERTQVGRKRGRKAKSAAVSADEAMGG
jgi:hypothetical protein